MNLIRRITVTVFLLGCCVALPSLVFAQASITGVVRDGSGAVLPGVTVEASSTALIETVRTVVTDGSGQYRIVDLRPGSYSITFSLAGFATVKRDGVAVVMVAIDNLGKGMAGTAVQNMNLMFGLPETTGLRRPGLGL